MFKVIFDYGVNPKEVIIFDNVRESILYAKEQSYMSVFNVYKNNKLIARYNNGVRVK